MPVESEQSSPAPSSPAPSSPAPSSPASGSDTKHTRSFIRAFVATNYLLGKRRQALGTGVATTEPAARRALAEITEQLSDGLQENRARALAAEVGRLMRSLGAQRLK